MKEEITYDRQILWFGTSGQDKIKQLTVAIIGLSGIGSHIVQQLAYVGVTNFILIDHESVSGTNLNRLIGANKDDLGKQKVEIAERVIKFTNHNANIKKIASNFITAKAIASLKKSDLIFGCMDNDGSRLILTEFCKAYDKPYFDIATEIIKDDWGGRVVFTDKEEGCLMCRGELDQKEIRKDLLTDKDRADEERIYGVKKSQLQGTGPSVVSLNGILASLAITEFLVYVTGIRKVQRHFTYRGKMNVITHPTEDPKPDCYYCKVIVGSKDKANILRYIKKNTR